MNKINAIKLPIHRLHLLKFWEPKSAERLHKANSLIAKIIMRKLWKEGLEPGKEVPSFVEDDANAALNEVREAIEGNNDSLLGDIFEAVKETRELLENGLDQDLTRRIILAYSQFYYENNTSPRPLVWVEAAERPRGLTLAPRGYWHRVVVEPTKDQLCSRLAASGLIFTRRAFDACLLKIGLSGPNGLEGGKEGRPSKQRKTKK
jgi:hypothetical protein